MKTKITFLIITSIVFQILLTRCNSDNNDVEKNEIITIAISEGIKNSATYKLSDIAKSIKYVPLETREPCLIKHIDKIKAIDSLLVILDGREKLFLFDRKGKFITRIGNKGRGPGEYTAISDFAINEVKRQITIVDGMDSKKISYSSDGNYISEEKLDEPFNWIEDANGKITLASSLNRDNTIIRLEDDQNNIIKLNKNELNLPETKNGISTGTILYCFNDTLTYWNDTNNMIVRIIGNKLKPCYLFDFSNDGVPVSQKGYQGSLDSYKDYVYIESFTETQDLIFINAVNKNYLRRLIYDKHKYEINLVNNEKFNELRFDFTIINDLDNSIPFWPDRLGRIDSKTVYQSFYANQFKESSNEKIANDIKNSSELSEIINNSSEMDNPVLMIVSLK